MTSGKEKFVYITLDEKDGPIECYDSDWLKENGNIVSISLPNDMPWVSENSIGTRTLAWCHENLGQSFQLRGNLESKSKWKVYPVVINDENLIPTLRYDFLFVDKDDAIQFKLRFG